MSQAGHPMPRPAVGVDEPTPPKEKQMHTTPLSAIAIFAGLLWLSGCDRTPETPLMPTVEPPMQTQPGSTAGTASDPSVPSADAVLPSASTMTEPPPTSPTGVPSDAQESKAMPMPGQNNDHSSPLGPGKAASAP